MKNRLFHFLIIQIFTLHNNVTFKSSGIPLENFHPGSKVYTGIHFSDFKISKNKFGKLDSQILKFQHIVHDHHSNEYALHFYPCTVEKTKEYIDPVIVVSSECTMWICNEHDISTLSKIYVSLVNGKIFYNIFGSIGQGIIQDPYDNYIGSEMCLFCELN